MKNDNTIIRVEKRERYVVFDKYFLEEDDRLSWKATAILAYLLAKPDGWEIRVADLIKRKQGGRDSVRAGLRELIQAGYLKRRINRDENGKFLGYIYIVHERPITAVEPESPETENPAPDKPSPGKPAPENPPLVNNNNSLNNKLNKQQQHRKDDKDDVVVADNRSKQKEHLNEQKVTDDEVEILRKFAAERGIERGQKFWRSYLANADNLEHAKSAVASCVEYACRPEVKEVRNLDGLLFNALLKFTFDGRSPVRTIHNSKKDKYADLILNRITEESDKELHAEYMYPSPHPPR